MERYWTPIRRGDLYCSPRCGMGCTWKAYQQATAEAKALADRLNAAMGPGWEPEVWENWGWNYAATKKGARVRPDLVSGNNAPGSPRTGGWAIRSFSAWLPAGIIQPQIIEHAASPVDAICNALLKAAENLEKQADVLDAIRNR